MRNLAPRAQYNSSRLGWVKRGEGYRKEELDDQGHYVGLVQPLRKWQDWEYRECRWEWELPGGGWVFSIWGPYYYRVYFPVRTCRGTHLYCRFRIPLVDGMGPPEPQYEYKDISNI